MPLSIILAYFLYKVNREVRSGLEVGILWYNGRDYEV